MTFAAPRAIVRFLAACVLSYAAECATDKPIAELAGTIDDCCCDVHQASEVNVNYISPLLDALRSRVFFKYFKVNLANECPFWTSEGKCTSEGDCTLRECASDEVPSKWKTEDEQLASCQERSREAATAAKHALAAAKPAFLVDRQIGSDDLTKWAGESGDWVPMEAEAQMSYIDLTKNPEVNKGYGQGPDAAKVWISIYQENCFGSPSTRTCVTGKCEADMCYEERVFFRLMSGIQSSITAAVSANFHKSPNGYTPDLHEYRKGLGWFADRQKNVYFTFLFLLRAVLKAEDFLRSYPYDTGNPEDDAQTKLMMIELLSLASTRHCSAAFQGFDERAMFQLDDDSGRAEGGLLIERGFERRMRGGVQGGVPKRTVLKQDFREKFNNISRIMDCVTCESCRMHAKLKAQAIGTALKILFHETDSSISLERNEIIALVNGLGAFSNALRVIEEMRHLEQRADAQRQYIFIAVVAVAVVFCVGVLYGRIGYKKRGGSLRDVRDNAVDPMTPKKLGPGDKKSI